ncbi:zinc-binding dehydrogenase domain-containing protein [Phthorimaea operculella]|nr:zinc-binding dehydrogenase domain-containing protein [Phthorimaea operculella]
MTGIRGDFQTIRKANKSFTEAEVAFKNNWVTYLDGILQLHTLRDSYESVSELLQIRKLCIDVARHQKALEEAEAEGKDTLKAEYFEVHDLWRCGGVLVGNTQFTRLPMVDEPVSLKISKFVPRFKPSIDSVSAIQVYLQTVAENINKDTINVLGIMNSKEELPISEGLKAVLNDIPGVTIHYEQMRKEKVLAMRDQFLKEKDLVLVQNLTNDDNLCQMLYRVLRRDTFLINGEENPDERIRPSTLFRVVSSHIHNNQKLDLVKWRPTQATTASTVVTCRDPSELELLKGTREQLPQRHKLVILASYPPVAGLKNLVKQWRREADKNQIYLVMVSDMDGLDQLPELDLAYNALLNGVWGDEYFTNYEERVSVDRGITLRSGRIGDLSSLHWAETGELSGPGVNVNVHYASIGVKDVKKASGLFPLRGEKEPTYGMDFSGVTDSGDRVMGLVASGAASARIRARPELMWPVPEHWSLEDAVTVPSAYAHAFYCFNMKVQFRRGYSVLVHGGTGALGQAAIAVALAHGCEVFATVSDIRKKRFLMKLFPDLKEDHIGNSRDASFGDMVRSLTNDQNCNIVISGAKGEFKNISLNCLSPCGILLDTEQLPSQEPYAFGMYFLTKERNYVPIDFGSMLRENNVEDMKTLQVLVSEGIARGYVRPLSRMLYMPEEVPRAFRLLAASRHRGRVVIKLQDKFMRAEPRITCSPELAHVVLCDAQSVGLQLAQRLIDRGARKLHLHCANPSKNLEIRVKEWESQGVKVQVSSEELSSKGIVSLLSESNSLGPVEGIYFIATDAVEKNVDKLAVVVANIDLAARKLCPSVRYFAIVNAVVNVGHKTCQSRARDGLPVTQLNIPALRKPDAIDQSVEGAISWRAALNALERALHIEIPENTEETATLLDLGMELAKVPSVAYFLKNMKHIVLPDDTIPEVTVQKIRELEELITGPVYPEIRGLDTFYRHVEPDEITATTDLTFLPTLKNSHIRSRPDEFDVNQTFLCLIPGMDGLHHCFETLCERVKLPAVILQPGLDNPHETDKELAQRYAKILMEKVKIRDHFYLLGYESGVSTVLEVAAILEEHGMTGTVFCVGNTPTEFRWLLNRILGETTTDEDLQNVLIRHMYNLMIGNDDGIDKAIQNLSTWQEKVEVCVRTLLGKVAHSAQYARHLIEVYYTKLVQARTYEVQPRVLKSKVVLLHASDLNADVSPAEDLQRFSEQPVSVHELKEPLVHATKDLRCANIINRYLSPEILQEFAESNRCEIYVLNAEDFMMNAEEAMAEMTINY